MWPGSPGFTCVYLARVHACELFLARGAQGTESGVTMTQPIDTAAYYTKLANNEPITENEIVALLKEYEGARLTAVHLADCHAATLESLPKAASKSMRSRLVGICRNAACLLEGGFNVVSRQAKAESVRERCLRAVRAAECA